MLNKTGPVSTETTEVVSLQPPAWLSNEAREVWDRKINQLVVRDLLINLDIETLALYCESISQYAKLSTRSPLSTRDHRNLQRRAMIILQGAEKLGFTPAARIPRKTFPRSSLGEGGSKL